MIIEIKDMDENERLINLDRISHTFPGAYVNKNKCICIKIDGDVIKVDEATYKKIKEIINAKCILPTSN